jgi:Uma2 family endonuclease
VGVPTIKTGPMTVEEFYAFTDRRPDYEKWELIDGEPILKASPSPIHQWIVKNLTFALTLRERQPNATWAVLPGLGVRVSQASRPEPDLLIILRPGGLSDSAAANPSLSSLGRDVDQVIVAFEVLSPSTESHDLRWKRTAYTALPSLTHYVVIAQDAVDVVVFAREVGFAERHLRSLDDPLEFAALGMSLPLSEIYRDIGLE